VGKEPSISIRAATSDDVEGLAYLLYLAGKSHMPISVYEMMFQVGMERQLEILRQLLMVRPWFHHSEFLIAVVDGEGVASLCGYSESDKGVPRLGDALMEIGWSQEDVRGVTNRLDPLRRVYPTHPEDAWVLEHAATLEGYRRMGLITSLFNEIIDRGQEKGYNHMELAIFTGNLPAQRAYEKLGFLATDEYSHPSFESIFDCPGMTRMILNL
jgi:ribosomal protein S18 acetylase RimI-like enzyme